MANFEVGGYPTEDYAIWVNTWRNASRNWASGELKWPYPSHFDKFHFPYMCGMCKRGKLTNTKVMQCAKCKVATYCCREHQAKAWTEHKEVCKYLANYFTNVYDSSLVQMQGGWKYYLLTGMGVVRAMAGSKDPFNAQMNKDEWVFQRHCQVCFFNPADRRPPPEQKDSVLVECPACHCVAHCNTVVCAAFFNAIHTREACELSAIGLAIVVMTMQNGDQPWCFATESRETVTNPPAGWHEYFTRKLHDMNLPPLLRLPPAMAMATDFLSIPLTIVNSLRLAYGNERLATMKRVEIHIIGAEISDSLFGDRKYHEILHWLPACEELVTYLIGPSSARFKDEPGALTREYNDVPERVCDNCKAAGVKHFMRFACGLYHDVVAPLGTSPHSNPQRKLLLEHATLAIACNSGLHDDQGSQGRPLDLSAMWEPTVRLLGQSNVPCVWTSWNADEARLDQAKLESWGSQGAGGLSAESLPGTAPISGDRRRQRVLLHQQPCRDDAR